MGEKEHNDENEDCRQSRGERCLRPALFINERLRRTPADGETATESGSEVRRCERQIFLIGIEPSAVLGDEHSPNRGCFDGAEKKTSKGKRKQLVQILPVNGRQPERRNSLRHGADQLYAVCLERKRRCGDDPPDHDKKRDRFVLEKNFSNNEERQRDSSNDNLHRVCFTQVLEKETRIFPEASVSAMKTEKLGQLCAGKKKRHAAFEAGHDTL